MVNRGKWGNRCSRGMDNNKCNSRYKINNNLEECKINNINLLLRNKLCRCSNPNNHTDKLKVPVRGINKGIMGIKDIIIFREREQYNKEVLRINKHQVE